MTTKFYYKEESMMSSSSMRWLKITNHFRAQAISSEILSEDPPHILLMLVDQYNEPVYKRLIEYQLDGLTPTERAYEDECNEL